MDKLRALQYFVASAQSRSFTAAARSLNVSVPAIARLVGALEKSLGVSLLERSVHGITLTPDGTKYLEACKQLMEQLAAADEVLRGATVRPRGTLILGAPPILSQHCILPALPVFHLLYPDITIDIRNVDKPTSTEANATELMVLHGCPRQPDLVHRHLASSRLMICASPNYWATHDRPQTPKDLKNHQCLLFRDQEGTVIDFWEQEKDGSKESVTVSGWLVSSQRDVLLDAAIAGMGVVRITDLTAREPLNKGQLVPVLTEWESKQSPPISLLYRSNQRRIPRVKLFIEFLTDLFHQLESERSPSLVIKLEAERPHWYRRRHSRASATPRDKG
jgi:DNA-binding transcriptional LysR family regulator